MTSKAAGNIGCACSVLLATVIAISVLGLFGGPQESGFQITGLRHFLHL